MLFLRIIIIRIDITQCIIIIDTVYGSEATDANVLLNKKYLNLKSQNEIWGGNHWCPSVWLRNHQLKWKSCGNRGNTGDHLGYTVWTSSYS